MANSFYESEGRPSTDHGRIINPTNKTRELARAIGREREGLVPSFRPPSSWTQRSSHHDVVWTGEIGDDMDANDDQFSDAESWDADTHTDSHAANNLEHDPTTSVYGHVRPTSIGSSIFAGRGARSERRRREAPPPLPTLPTTHQQQHKASQHLGSDATGLLSPSPHGMLSPFSDASGFESSSQYSGFDSRDEPADPEDLANGFDMQSNLLDGPSRRSDANDDADVDKANDASSQHVPSRNSSRTAPPIPLKDASRSSNDSLNRLGCSPDDEPTAPRRSPARLADGTVVPKMPPVPQTSDPHSPA